MWYLFKSIISKTKMPRSSSYLSIDSIFKEPIFEEEEEERPEFVPVPLQLSLFGRDDDYGAQEPEDEAREPEEEEEEEEPVKRTKKIQKPRQRTRRIRPRIPKKREIKPAISAPQPKRKGRVPKTNAISRMKASELDTAAKSLRQMSNLIVEAICTFDGVFSPRALIVRLGLKKKSRRVYDVLNILYAVGVLIRYSKREYVCPAPTALYNCLNKVALQTKSCRRRPNMKEASFQKIEVPKYEPDQGARLRSYYYLKHWKRDQYKDWKDQFYREKLYRFEMELEGPRKLMEQFDLDQMWQ